MALARGSSSGAGHEDDPRGVVHDHAHEQQDEVDEQQDEETVVRDAEYAFHDGLRDLQHHIGLAQHHAAKNHDHDAAHGHGGILGAAEGIAQVQAPIDEEPDRQRVNYGYGGGFGGGHGPGIDAAEDEHGHGDPIFAQLHRLVRAQPDGHPCGRQPGNHGCRNERKMPPARQSWAGAD